MEEAENWLRPVNVAQRDAGHKPLPYLSVYESYLASLRNRPFTLLELGVWKGASLSMWAENFPQATIVGLDIKLPSNGAWPKNVHVYEGSQADCSLLKAIAEKHAPLGFDVIIDDASHIGDQSCASLNCLFGDHLVEGGLYFIEDWGTGYWSHWPDGLDPAGPISLCSEATVQEPHIGLSRVLSRIGLRRGKRSEFDHRHLGGHGVGMVGLIKRLVDHVGQGDINADLRGNALHIASMSVHPGLVALLKY
jgi:hypothetical protein